MLEEINKEMETLKTEYNSIIANMNSLNKTYENLNNRKIEIEGAYKVLDNMRKKLSSPPEGLVPNLEVIESDTQNKSE